jgi:hypothetical protein
MNLNEMRAIARRDLRDEDESDYRWTDDELNRHISHAVKELSEALPLEEIATLATTPGSREISLATLADRVMVEAVEYSVGQFPPRYQRFAVWGETLTLLGEEVPDGSDCHIYYGKLHTLDSDISTIPPQCEDIVAAGACGYAAIEMAGYSINRVNIGGSSTIGEWAGWGQDKLTFFRTELKRLGRRNRIRTRQLYIPYYPPVSKSQ